jgi:hypothetical protein
MKATGRFCIRLAGIGTATFYLFLASLSSASGLPLAQSVTFAGVRTTLFNGESGFGSVTLDGAQNLYISDTDNHRVVELPWTGTSYGPPITLPTHGTYPHQLAVDSAGDVFICMASERSSVVELPKTSTGWGPQVTLPFTGLTNSLYGIAVDRASDVFLADEAHNRVWELPMTSTGYGPQVALPLGRTSFLAGLALDTAGDLFISDMGYNGPGRILELPKTSTGWGPRVTLPTTGLLSVTGISVDPAGDLFLADGYSGVVELPRTPTGYGPQITIDRISSFGVAVDNAGDLFIEASAGYRLTKVFELQTQAVNFGGANVCAPGETTPAPCFQTMTLNYNINANMILGAPTVLTGAAPDLDFTLAGGSTCTAAVTEGASCIVNVIFAPQATGTRNGTVEITDDSGAVLTTTSIFGLGASGTIDPPLAQLSPTYLQFGTAAFGTAETLPLTVTNIGAGILAVGTSISTYSGGPSRSFTIADSTCGGGVSAGNSCILQVEYSPKSIATHYGLLTLQTNQETNPIVKLRGAAYGLSVLGGVSGASLKFGSVSSGSTEVLPLTVTNVGLPRTVTVGTSITVRATTRPTTTYKILTTAQNTCQTGIAAGESCTLPVEFAPTSSGVHDDLLTLTPSVGGGSTNLWLIGSTP